MWTLVFDTTSNCCAAALMQDTQIKEKYSEEMEFGQAEALLPQIRQMLNKQNLNFADIDLLGVCVGPGSFTGVRSSVAAARAMSLARPQMSVTGVTAFEAYLQAIDDFDLAMLNAVIIETKREDFYFQLFNGRREKLCEASALPYEEIIDLLKGKTVTLIGSGVERFLDKPSGLVLHNVNMEKSVPLTQLATCTLQKYQQKKLNFPKPLYLRAPDVCVKS
jgi:tRNA threonylcarbamoyl adenosine modification protein YeaZ